jgi:tripartite-type tricarboxylate transporter receptor subunit TctC
MVPIGNITSEPYGFVEALIESPFKTWADLVKAGKENPGKLSCGGPGAGGMMELIMDEITKASGIKTRYVPFAGAGASKIALLGGHIDFRVCQPPEAITMIRAGKTRGLAVSTDRRMEALPDVPTFKGAGYRGNRRPDPLNLGAAQNACQSGQHAHEDDRKGNKGPRIYQSGPGTAFVYRRLSAPGKNKSRTEKF